jgi:hypothetical protein
MASSFEACCAVMSSQKRKAPILPTPPAVSSRKRPPEVDVDDTIQPYAKRKAPILPTPPAVSSRKRPLEVDVDDTIQPHAKRPAFGSQKSRMELYVRLLDCQTWESYCRILNTIPKNDEFTIALALNDSAEWARLMALNQLEAQLYSRIIENISEIQMDKNRFDPKFLFPCVATNKFMETLPSSVRKCNICDKCFEEGSDIIWKFCGSHSLHNKCLRESFDQMPLIGTCDCILDA